MSVISIQSLPLPTAWLEGTFSYGMVRGAQLRGAFLEVGSTHRASRSEARNGVSWFSDPLVSLGPGQILGGKNTWHFNTSSSICLRGAKADHNLFYWVNFIKLSYFEIEEERKRHHDHHQKNCSLEVIAQAGWAESAGKTKKSLRTWRGCRLVGQVTNAFCSRVRRHCCELGRLKGIL